MGSSLLGVGCTPCLLLGLSASLVGLLISLPVGNLSWVGCSPSDELINLSLVNSGLSGGLSWVYQNVGGCGEST
jgi:hypothetical protein